MIKDNIKYEGVQLIMQAHFVCTWTKWQPFILVNDKSLLAKNKEF